MLQTSVFTALIDHNYCQQIASSAGKIIIDAKILNGFVAFTYDHAFESGIVLIEAFILSC